MLMLTIYDSERESEEQYFATSFAAYKKRKNSFVIIFGNNKYISNNFDLLNARTHETYMDFAEFGHFKREFIGFRFRSFDFKKRKSYFIHFISRETLCLN